MQCKKDSIAFSLKRLFGPEFGISGHPDIIQMDKDSYVCFRAKKTRGSEPHEGWRTIKVSDLRWQKEHDMKNLQSWQKEYLPDEVRMPTSRACSVRMAFAWSLHAVHCLATQPVQLATHWHTLCAPRVDARFRTHPCWSLLRPQESAANSDWVKLGCVLSPGAPVSNNLLAPSMEYEIMGARKTKTGWKVTPRLRASALSAALRFI